MSHEYLVKRTIYVSECSKCGERKERESDPPKERRCSCGTWVPYLPVEWVGKDLRRNPQ